MKKLFEGAVGLLVEYRIYYITGIKNTLLISLFALIIGTIFGSILAFMRLSENKFTKMISSIYIELIRGTPMMVQLPMVFFGSYVLTGQQMDAFVAALIAVSLNSAAYVAEIVRSGIQSIDKGQYEAGRSLGLSKSKTMRHIILPQSIKNILPALGNEFITLIKETSIASTLGVGELMFASNQVQNISYQPFTPLVIVASIYFLLTFTLSKLLSIVERSLNYND